MVKLNPTYTKSRKSLFNLNSFNSLKKDQTNIKIFKDSSFDSNFNSIQSLNTNLSNIQLLPSNNSTQGPVVLKRGGLSLSSSSPSSYPGASPSICSNYPNSEATPTITDRQIWAKENKQIQLIRNNKNIKNPKFIAILRAIRSIRLNRDEWRLIRIINLMEKKIRRSPFFGCLSPDLTSYPKLGERQHSAQLFAELSTPSWQGHSPFSNSNIPSCLLGGGTPAYKWEQIINNNIISSSANILLRNTNRYKNLKSILSSILKKKIRSISEVLEDKPIKNYILYSYLKNTISLIPPHLNGGKTKLSLNKYKGRKYGSFIKYNKIIGYNFNSIFNQSAILNANTFVYSPDSRFPASEATLPNLNKLALDLPAGSFEAAGRGTLWGVHEGGPLAPQMEGGRAIQSKNIDKNREASEATPNIYIKDIYKLLFYLFKSMYCLISKPVLKFTNDKVTIQLFYYLNIPKKKIFRLFSIFYINSIKKKWLALVEKKKINLNSSQATQSHYIGGPLAPQVGGGVASLPQIYINWKLRKAISRFKNNNIPATTAPTDAKQEGGKNILFKLRKFNLTAKEVYQNKFKLICAILSNKFNKPVELQLIRLHHPYHDSNILVNLLSLNIKNRKKARVAVLTKKIYNKKPVKFLNDPNLNKETANFIPAFLSGLNIKIAGRLMGEPIIPRITTKIFGKGANATGKINYLDVARITKKNRKGAYTIKITSGQNFF